MSLYAVMMEDEELKEVMMDVITNYSRVILASKERWDEGRREGDLEEKMNRALSIWSHNDFGVEVSWTLGAAGLALSYDVLYNDMSTTQRDTVRKAIATGAKGRRGYGTGKPRGFAASNHYGYHGDLLVMLSAIEGEPGYDQETYDGIRQVLTDLVFESQNGRDIILADPNGARKLLVRVLRADGVDGTTPAQIEAELQPYTVSQDRERGTRVRGQRLILSQHSIAPHFRVMLYPFRTGSPLPRVRMRGGPVEGYEITTGAVTRVLTMSPDPERGVRIGIE